MQIAEHQKANTKYESILFFFYNKYESILNFLLHKVELNTTGLMSNQHKERCDTKALFISLDS